MRGGLDDPVEAAQRAAAAAEAQLRTPGQGQGGVAAPPAQQPVAQPPPAQAVHQGLAEGGGARLRGRGALEGEGGATAGGTAGVQLLEERGRCEGTQSHCLIISIFNIFNRILLWFLEGFNN